MGLELSNWLYNRGCRNLVLTSRSGIRTGLQSRTVRVLREKGVNIKVSTKDVTSKQDTDALIKEAMKMGPVGGIFNLAVVSFLSCVLNCWHCTSVCLQST